jgi:hypothetical protein
VRSPDAADPAMIGSCLTQEWFRHDGKSGRKIF